MKLHGINYWGRGGACATNNNLFPQQLAGGVVALLEGHRSQT